MYAYGHGTERNDDLAAAWFRLAGTRGHSYAAAALQLVRGKDSTTQPLCPGEDPITAVTLPADVPEHIRHLVLRLAPRYRLDPALVIAVIKVESDFRSGAVSRAKAQGLMQIIPATGKRFGLQNAFDPEQNIAAGMTYLRWLLDRFGDDLELALAAYNSGENAVYRYKGVPPYPETIEYLRRFRELGFIRAKPARSSLVD
jgi:soluble lytic murein transglycosylase-like protein